MTGVVYVLLRYYGGWTDTRIRVSIGILPKSGNLSITSPRSKIITTELKPLLSQDTCGHPPNPSPVYVLFISAGEI